MIDSTLYELFWINIISFHQLTDALYILIVKRLNLPRLLHDNSLKNSIPVIATDFDIPTVVYKFSQTTGTKIFNFDTFGHDLDVDKFLADPTILPCKCSNFPFIDNHHGHMTGNLKVIGDNRLRKLLSKGPKYREPKPHNWQHTRKSITEGLK